VRVLRAGSFAVAAVTLALVAHSVAGGHRPAALALVVAVVVMACGATWATGRRLGRLATASGLVLAQLGLHTWFSLSGGHGCDLGGLVLSHHHVQGLACAQGGVDATASAAGPDTGSWLMPAAHLAAVLLTALLLAHGEALLWRLADLAGARALRLANRGVTVSGPSLVLLVSRVPAALTGLLLEPVRGRAPPLAVRAG
jgi:hypothetical protein